MIGPFGETLVMDWGVAKLFGRNDGGVECDVSTATASCETAIRCETLNGSATTIGQAVGTPAYMSPEQAAGALDALGPSSDVYSLGATLYVMLADRRPFEGDVTEVLQNVREGRWQPPRQLKPHIPQALDAICRRAMAHDPADRYGSAAAMAGDVERWLADEPVAAWREPWPDRARRWVRRHQTLMAGWAAAVGVAVAALALAVPLLSLAWRNERAARRDERQQRLLALSKASEAEANAINATEEKDRAEQALRFLVQTFRKPDPSIDGRTLKVVDLLNRAVVDLDSSFKDQPVMKATLLTAIGETLSGLGMHTDALTVFTARTRSPSRKSRRGSCGHAGFHEPSGDGVPGRGAARSSDSFDRDNPGKAPNQAGSESRRYDRIDERPGSRLLAVWSSQESDSSLRGDSRKGKSHPG